MPIWKEAALDYHRMGSKIYCLGSDGGKGEYASKEMIQAHEGLFGMELQMWERIEENDLDYADEDFRLLDGGVYENDEISIEEVAEELLEDEGWTGEHIRGDYDQLMEKVEEMDEVVMAEIQKSQGEYKPFANRLYIYDEAKEVMDQMLDRLLFDVPEEYHIDRDHFYTYLDDYYENTI